LPDGIRGSRSQKGEAAKRKPIRRVNPLLACRAQRGRILSGMDESLNPRVDGWPYA
jgi:hypothetical protein